MSENEEEGKVGIKKTAERLEDAMTRSSDEPLANGSLNELSDGGFMDVIRRARTAIVEFYTSSCPYCRQMAPVLDELATEYRSRVYFAMINIDEVQGAAEKFDVEGVPLLVAFKKGNPVAKMEGLRGIDELDGWIDTIHKGLRPMELSPGPVTKLILGEI